MKRFFIFSLIFILLGTIVGCGKKTPLKKSSAKQQKTDSQFQKIESVDLAEAILKPRPYQFTLPRDPFKPLFGKLSLMSQEEMGLEHPPPYKVIGILFKEGSPLTLLEVPGIGVVLLREGDKIERYTVKKIETKKIILERDNKNFILEIGEEK